MKPDRRPLGSRLALYSGAVVGLFRAIDELADEGRRPKEEVEPQNRVEPDDLKPKNLWIFAVSLLGSVWAIVLLIYPLFAFFKYDRTGGRQPSKVLAYLPPRPPEPRNVNQPYRVLDDYLKSQDGQLEHYGWADRTKGSVYIPIERAMDIVAKHGIPPTPAAAKNVYYPPQAASMRTGFEEKVEPEER